MHRRTGHSSSADAGGVGKINHMNGVSSSTTTTATITTTTFRDSHNDVRHTLLANNSSSASTKGTTASAGPTTTTGAAAATAATTTTAMPSSSSSLSGTSNQARRVRRRRKVKSTAFSTYYGNSKFDIWTTILIICSGIVFCLILWALWFLLQLIDIEPYTTRIFHGNTKLNALTGRRGQQHRVSLDEMLPLAPSRIYRIPGSMDLVGDKSDEYARLRKSFDEKYPADNDRSLQALQNLRLYSFQTEPMYVTEYNRETYDIYNCPQEPPPGYPYQWNTLDILKNWPSDDPQPRPKIFQGICVFDYEKDYMKALIYRRKEVPFVVKNDPQVARTAERWNTPQYMDQLMGNVKHRCEYSENNHFLYWNPGPNPKGGNKIRKSTPDGWEQPTKMLRLTYRDWLDHANVTDDKLGPDQPHWYFRLIGCGLTGPQGECDHGSSEYLYDELPFFQPQQGLLYVVEPETQKGIHCRFGMKGVIAENHFDGSRNAISVLGGARRYILSHPDQCDNLALLPKGHPSARHSAVDWSQPDLEQFPQFGQARSNEVVLQAGDVLYLPTNWFHFIVSLSLNFQCNTRSGISNEYMDPIQACGF